MITSLLFALLAAGELPSLAVIPVIVSEGRSPISALEIGDHVVQAARGRPIRVLRDEDLFVEANSGLVEQVRACGSDEACMSARLSAVSVELGAIVLVNSIAEPPIVAVRLVDVRQKRVVASAVGPLAASEVSIGDAVRSRLVRLLDERGLVVAPVAEAPKIVAPVVEESALIESPWLWIAIGAAVIAGITVGVVASQSEPGMCICVGPRDQCPPC